MNKHAAQAVFLSYASQDVETARRLADALRAFGVEVWFDQNELRGGDASIRLDPEYAPSQAALAECFSWCGTLCMAPRGEIVFRAKAAALEALRLDAELAEAHASLAAIKWTARAGTRRPTGWRWISAGSPASPTCHHSEPSNDAHQRNLPAECGLRPSPSAPR